MIELGDYVACIVEGSAERAIIDVLLDNNFLCFGRDRLLDGELIRTRSSKSFEERYLRKGFKGSITVLRVLDSRRERFTLRKEYEHKVNVINVITAPEIVKPNFMLFVVFDDGKQVQYDVKEDFNLPGFIALKDINGLFNHVRLDESRTCVFWNKDIDIPSDVIYEYGTDVREE